MQLSALLDGEAEMEKQQNLSGAKQSAVWDCGSSLYDSFELESFEKQLGSAIAARTHSMPRLPEPASVAEEATAFCRPRRKPSAVAKSVKRLVWSVFGVKAAGGGKAGGPVEKESCAGGGGSGRAGRLATIPEGCEKGPESPEACSAAVRKAASERFTVRGGFLR